MDFENRIEQKVDKITEDITDIKVTLASQHITLTEHTRRSLASEKAVELLARKIEPIERHVSNVEFCLRAIGFISIIGSIMLAFLRIKELIFPLH